MSGPSRLWPRRQDAIGLRRQEGAAEDFVDRGRAAESIRIRNRLDRGVEPVVVEIAEPKLCDFFRSQLLIDGIDQPLLLQVEIGERLDFLQRRDSDIGIGRDLEYRSI